jgi:tRNA C32,U32 (ribose-2'-O)-methylase TrmJ
MTIDSIEVEVNLMASGKMKTNVGRDTNIAQDKAQPSTSQTSEERFEAMMRNMEQMMERMALGNRPNPGNKLMVHPEIREDQLFHRLDKESQEIKEIRGIKQIKQIRQIREIRETKEIKGNNKSGLPSKIIM